MSYAGITGKPIRIAVVEDDQMVREVLEILLNGSPGFTCVAAYGNGEDAVAGLPEVNPDVVLMDINLPGISGIECIIRLKEQKLPMQFIMLTIFEDADAIFQSLIGRSFRISAKTNPSGQAAGGHPGCLPGRIAHVEGDRPQGRPVVPAPVSRIRP